MSTYTKLPHCPRCGGRKHPNLSFCSNCHFNAEWWGDSNMWTGARGWEIAVRAELARQALEMRAHSAATQNMAHGCSLFTLSETVLMVTNDYEWLVQHPIRLPGEDA